MPQSPLSQEHQDAIELISNNFFLSNNLGFFEETTGEDLNTPSWFFRVSYCPEYPFIKINTREKSDCWSDAFISLDIRLDNEGVIHDISFEIFIGHDEEEGDSYTFGKSFTIDASVMDVAEVASPFKDEVETFKKQAQLFIDTFI